MGVVRGGGEGEREGEGLSKSSSLQILAESFFCFLHCLFFVHVPWYRSFFYYRHLRSRGNRGFSGGCFFVRLFDKSVFRGEVDGFTGRHVCWRSE
ncbi:hypothetical protein HETIRDRAFT_174663 [Heterobasidion irregulare TC 32-1]|uniref:Uncharacterized protein n=1 Tax=Heterobasidion irregulare (strain TC 32-1) TaxID=747525 RepID=W4JUN1_HETIT|nr:uncharacterized protein HETIRDRAFT_174663 [Heterobasidion irregulare TC 32-1]ETW76596.1 hypothetical protein HETIRDRAFT_174663 [Heterobasidion irregulare TC 32-1]